MKRPRRVLVSKGHWVRGSKVKARKVSRGKRPAGQEGHGAGMSGGRQTKRRAGARMVRSFMVSMGTSVHKADVSRQAGFTGAAGAGKQQGEGSARA